ncbi:MAG: alpha amylase C-terminal domain-containing protein [Candidatus Gastranaerophilaceae bacterium]
MVKLSNDNFFITQKVNNQPKFAGNCITKNATTMHLNTGSYANYNAQNLQAYHLVKPAKISFGKRMEEHRSWGANIVDNSDPNQPVTKFKVWAPYADEVIAEIRNPKDIVSLTEEEFKKEGLRPTDKWVGVWHTSAKTDDEKSTFIALKKSDNGTFETTEKLLYPNGMYRYILKKDGKEYAKVKDPVSKCQPHIFSWSQVYNQQSFDWGENEKDWVSGKISEKVSDFDCKNHLVPSTMVACQIHIGTVTKEGDLVALKKEIDRIAKSGIYNSVLLMPVEGTYDNNWGYDGVDKYAVTRSIGDEEGKSDAIRKSDLLKEVVKYCHEKKLNIGIDWVPSHMFESSGFVLNKFGPYDKPGGWGGIKFKLQDTDFNSQKVRDYIVNIPLYLIDNYHFDFIRGDQSPAMESNFAMKQVAAEIKYHFPHTVIHWEDHRTQDGITRELKPEEKCSNNLNQHCDFIKKLENNGVSLENLGANEHWDFAFSHSIEANLREKEVGGYSPNISTLANNMKDVGGTKYIVSHDETGNDGGKRLIIKVIADQLIWNNNNLKNIEGESPSQRGIRGDDAANALANAFLFDGKNSDNSFREICDKFGLINISKNDAEKVITTAVAKQKLGLGVLFMAPGSKMIFDGDDYGETNLFRFSRKQAYDETSLNIEKGYNMAQAWDKAKLEPEKHTVLGIENFSKTIANLLKRNDALQENQPIDKLDDMIFIEDNNSKVLGIKRFNFAGNEVIALYNFSNNNYENYDIKNQGHLLPNGHWKETINSNYAEFGGNGNFTNKERIFHSDGNTPVTVSIPANSAVILEKVDNSGKIINS